MDHFGQPVTSVVAAPVGDCVIGAGVTVQLLIQPLVEDGPISPPQITQHRDCHVTRTKTHVAIIETRVKMTAYPREISRAAVEEGARASLLETLEADNQTPTPAAYARGLKALTQRIVNRMRQYGVEIT